MKKKKLILLLFLLIFLIIINLLFFILLPFYDSQTLKSDIKEEIYIVPYLGDIDGDVSEDWFFFYEKILNFHEDNKIPVTLSFYPVSIRDNEEFNRIFAEMYKSEYIDLMQKGYKGDELEMRMETLSLKQQTEIIQAGQNHFKRSMQKILNQDNIELPVSYNQIGGKFNNNTMKAAESVGLKIYFDMYVGDNVVALESSDDFDIIQYGQGFTKRGESGRNTIFFTSEQMFYNINNYNRTDITILKIDVIKIIPIWLHQQDFEDKKTDVKLDKEKWEVYTETLKALKQDSNVKLITAKQIYELRHSSYGISL